MLSLNSISYAADFFPYAKRGWAMGSIVSSYFAALILGVPLGSWLGDVFGWNLVFGMLGAIALALLISTYFTLPTFNPGQHKTISGILPAEELRKYFGFLKAQKTVGALLSSFFASAGTVGFLTFVGVWLNGSFGISSSQIGLVFLVCGAAALVASPLAGSLSDRIGKRRQFVISSLFLALFLVVLPRLRWGPALFAVFGVISLSAALRQGPMEALLTQVVSPMSRGSFIALKNSFSQLGIGLAAMLSGMLFQWGGYSPVCILGAISNLLAAVGMLLMVRERYL